MSNEEFIQATSRLEGYFDKEYKTEQLKEMFIAVKGWTIEKYTKAVNYCIRNNKYLPKIADLTSADTATVQTQSTKAIEYSKCKKLCSWKTQILWSLDCLKVKVTLNSVNS